MCLFYSFIPLNRCILYFSTMRSLENIAMVERELIRLPGGPPMTVVGAGVTARNCKQDLEATAGSRSDPDQRVAEDQGAEAMLPRFQIMNLIPRPLNLMMMTKPNSVPQLGVLPVKTSANKCKRSNPLAQWVVRMRKISRNAWH